MRNVFDLGAKKVEIQRLTSLIESENLWDDADQAKKTLSKRSYLSKIVDEYYSLLSSLEENVELMNLAVTEGLTEEEAECIEELQKLDEKISKLKIECLFSGEADSNDCFIEIHSGAGGTESQDWADMLLRMYMRWAESHKFETEINYQMDGDEAGIKSVTFLIKGHNAYGWCKHESGIHRLVRISPFDSNARRHTSFASVWVYPVIDDAIEINIQEKDLRIDTYRASGAGGQHVNKTDSAVRITHLPTKIVVQSQNSRSQHRNKADCMKMLKSRLYELELQKRDDANQERNSCKLENSWGNQVRSYILHPYQLVKDLRSKYESSKVMNVLDGELDLFMSSLLLNKV